MPILVTGRVGWGAETPDMKNTLDPFNSSLKEGIFFTRWLLARLPPLAHLLKKVPYTF